MNTPTFDAFYIVKEREVSGAVGHWRKSPWKTVGKYGPKSSAAEARTQAGWPKERAVFHRGRMVIGTNGEQR